MIRERGLHSWLPTYLQQTLHRMRMRQIRGRQLTHVMFLICDHFEPRHAATRLEQPGERMRAWHEGYRQFQDEVHAQAGLRPLHTWFYPPHHGYENLAALSRMCFDGLGEVELHYHHCNDTEESLRTDLRRTLFEFRRRGLLMQCGSPPVERFGFIHGDWALDNSANGHFCGVNSELSLLQELGCWGDLTMPSANQCQTRKINSIYYAVDDPQQPKSHDWGVDARLGESNQPGLLLIQGPLGLNFRAPRYPRIENSNLNDENWGRADRLESWINCHVHVAGRPEWLFVKLHTHGAVERDFDALFGEKALSMHRQLAEQFNDGKKMRLHYVTARQAYNVIRAAEGGQGGDPSLFFDYELAPQVSSMYQIDVPHRVVECDRDKLVLQDIEGEAGALLLLRYPQIESIFGFVRGVTINARDSLIDIQLHAPEGKARIKFSKMVKLLCLGETRISSRVEDAGALLVTVVGAGPLRLRF